MLEFGIAFLASLVLLAVVIEARDREPGTICWGLTGLRIELSRSLIPSQSCAVATSWTICSKRSANCPSSTLRLRLGHQMIWYIIKCTVCCSSMLMVYHGLRHHASGRAIHPWAKATGLSGSFSVTLVRWHTNEQSLLFFGMDVWRVYTAFKWSILWRTEAGSIFFDLSHIASVPRLLAIEDSWERLTNTTRTSLLTQV